MQATGTGEELCALLTPADVFAFLGEGGRGGRRTARKSCFHVPGGSMGEDHAIVMQLDMIVTKISGSNGPDSTTLIAMRRGKW